MRDLTIRPYQPGDDGRILASFNTVFEEVSGAGYERRDMTLWRWQYLENPAGHRIHLAVAADGTVAGHYAALPMRVVTPQGPTVFSQIVDSFVHPDYRHGLKRPGLFVHTAVAALDRWTEELGDGVYWGLPVPQAKRISIRFLDYIEWRPIEYLSLDLADAELAAPDGIRIKKVSVIGSELEGLSTRFLADKRCTAVRDAAHLNWRYARCPERRYDLYEAWRDHLVVGFMALRPRHELLPGSCCIAELMVHEGDATVLDALLASAANRARMRDRSHLVTILAPWTWEAEQLRQRGFATVPSSASMYRSIGLRLHQPGLSVDQLEQGWWYSLGDTDLV